MTAHRFEEFKTWGTATHLEQTSTVVSIAEILPYTRSSNHVHHHNYNLFHVVKGTVVAIYVKIEDGKPVDVKKVTLGPNSMVCFGPGEWHRFECHDQNGAVMVETYWRGDEEPVSIADIERIDVGGGI